MKKSSYLIEFGQNLKNLRKDKGLSQEELALLCDLDRSYIGGVERGERNVSLINIRIISKALKVCPSVFFKVRL